MEEKRPYFEDEEPVSLRDADREELLASVQDDEIPFHIPRD
jgi:hypothetical protein